MEPIELEHVVGYSGEHSQVLTCHPKDPDYVLVGMGCNIVLQNLKDDHVQHFLQGHDEQISTISTSPAGTLVASGQEGSTKLAQREAQVIVWDLSHHVIVYRLSGIRVRVNALNFTKDEMFLAGCGADGSMYIWDMQTGDVVANISSGDVGTTLTWGEPEKGANSSRPEYVLYATVGHQVKTYRMIYSVANMQYQVEQRDFRLPAGMIRNYMDSCISPCGRSLLLCTSIGDINVFQVESLVYRASFPVCSGGAKSICACGPYIFVGGGDGTVKRLAGCGNEWKLDLETSIGGMVTNLSGYYDGNTFTLMAGTNQGCVYLINANSMKILRLIRSETSPLIGVSFRSTCSIRFATLNANGAMRVWDLSDYSVVAENTSVQKDLGRCILYDDHDDQVICGYASGAVRAFRATRGDGAGSQTWEICPAHRDGVNAVTATALYYATGGIQGGVRLWSRSCRAQLFEFSDHIRKAVVALVPDCRQAHLLHSCGEDRAVYTYDLKKERRMVNHQWSRNGYFTSMTQRLDSENELITSGSDGKLLTWDIDVPDPISQVTANGHGSVSGVSFTSVQVSPTTGKYVAASSSDSRVRVWDLEKGKLVATSAGNGFTEISAIAWSPDEKQIISVGLDKCICIWNFYVEALEEVLEEGKTIHK